MIPDLFELKGVVSRRRYLVTGLVLFAVKYALDYLLTRVVFHRSWAWFPYLDPLGEIHGLNHIPAADGRYAISMLAVALPLSGSGPL